MSEFADYNPSDFNDDGTIKVSPLLWLVIAYLSRHVLILMLGGVSTFMGARRGVDTSGLSALYSSPSFLLASLPAIAVLAVHFRRTTKGGALPRAIWKHGKLWLASAAALDLLILLAHWAGGLLGINEFQIAGAFLDVYIIMYVLRSSRVRHTFEAFPPAKLNY